MSLSFFEQDINKYLSPSNIPLPEPFFLTTREAIEAWLQQLKITNYQVDNDLVIHVKGDVNISSQRLANIPVQFGNVEGNFYCSFNVLTSLKGSPTNVGKNFDCSHNKLVSLKYAPINVGSLNCNNNQIKNLNYLPNISRGFDCSDNQIEKLINLPLELKCDLNIGNNFLTSLEGTPKIIKGDFYCSSNQLTSLEFGPNKVNGTYDCYNNHIKNIDIDCWIRDDFYCFNNPLENINLNKLKARKLVMDMKEEFEWDLIRFYDKSEKLLVIPYEDFKQYKQKQKGINDFKNNLEHHLEKHEATSQRKI